MSERGPVHLVDAGRYFGVVRSGVPMIERADTAGAVLEIEASGASAAEGRYPNPAESASAGVGEARPAEPPTEKSLVGEIASLKEDVLAELRARRAECGRLREQLDAARQALDGLPLWKLDDYDEDAEAVSRARAALGRWVVDDG